MCQQAQEFPCQWRVRSLPELQHVEKVAVGQNLPHSPFEEGDGSLASKCFVNDGATQPHPQTSPGSETLLRRLLEPPQRIDRPRPELAAHEPAQQRSAPP